MKAIKKNFENLKKVSDSLTSIPFSLGSFEVDFEVPSSNTIRLYSDNRDGIGSSILSKIPSNYQYRINFLGGRLYLTIWFK